MSAAGFRRASGALGALGALRPMVTSPRTTVAQLLRSPDETTATLTGWVKSLREQKKFAFVDIGDGSCAARLQVVMKKKQAELSWGSAVRISGRMTTTPKGQRELVADHVAVTGECPTEGYPFVARQTHTHDYVRQYLHLRPRTDYFSSVLRVRDAAVKAVHNYFDSLDYVNVHAPVLTCNDCEGAGEVFRVKCDTTTDQIEPYFGNETYLTVSGQLHLEAAAHGLSRVYSFGPTFRAENSKSRLHLSEFYMLEAETAFVDDLDEVMTLIENLLHTVTNHVLLRRGDDLKFLRGNEAIEWLDKPFIRMPYDEAIKLLSKSEHHFESPLKYGGGLSKEHELYLVKLMGGVPVFVIDWPKHLKSFYMRSLSEDDSKVAALDLLVPITGEVAGGSLRENDYEVLKRRLPSPDLQWYLDLRKYGSSPSGGFGLGFERYLQWICNVTNIKDTIPFPRWPHNCSM